MVHSFPKQLRVLIFQIMGPTSRVLLQHGLAKKMSMSESLQVL